VPDYLHTVSRRERVAADGGHSPEQRLPLRDHQASSLQQRRRHIPALHADHRTGRNLACEPELRATRAAGDAGEELDARSDSGRSSTPRRGTQAVTRPACPRARFYTAAHLRGRAVRGAKHDSAASRLTIGEREPKRSASPDRSGDRAASLPIAAVGPDLGEHTARAVNGLGLNGTTRLGH